MIFKTGSMGPIERETALTAFMPPNNSKQHYSYQSGIRNKITETEYRIRERRLQEFDLKKKKLQIVKYIVYFPTSIVKVCKKSITD